MPKITSDMMDVAASGDKRAVAYSPIQQKTQEGVIIKNETRTHFSSTRVGVIDDKTPVDDYTAVQSVEVKDRCKDKILTVASRQDIGLEAIPDEDMMNCSLVE